MGDDMPLEKGSSQEAIHKNIKELIDSGKSKDQAIAIAYKESGMAQDVDFDELSKLFDQWLTEEKKESAHAMDYDVIYIAEDEDRWITVKGSHVKVNGEGEVIAGANGKLGKKSDTKNSGSNSSKASSSKSTTSKVSLSTLPKDAPKHLKAKMTGIKNTISARKRNGVSMSDSQVSAVNKASELLSKHAKERESGGSMKGSLESRRSSTDRDMDVSNAVGFALAFSGGDTSRYSSEDAEKYKKILGMDEFAMDSARSYDRNGHLLVNRTVITKADVNGYRGSSIPKWKELGLQPDKEYMLLRDPDELRKSLDTFKGLQLLMQHIPVHAEEPEKESTIGSIGTVLDMDNDGRVWSSLRVYDQEGINYIESKDDNAKLGELSAGYAYDADMTAGTFNGKPYDGIMRNIHGNHVAIVHRGRIGSDAIIADSIEGQLMAKKIKVENGGLAKLQEQLGMDSAEIKKVILAVHGSTIALDEDDKKAKDEDDKKSDAEDEDIEIVEDSEDDKKAKDEDKQTQADKDNESEAMRLKEREKREEKDRTRDKEMAQDAAEIERNVVKRFQGINKALRQVEPLVGILGMDGFGSDHEVYEYALKQKGVETKGINTAGLEALVGAQGKPTVAMDSAPRGKASDETTNILKRFG